MHPLSITRKQWTDVLYNLDDYVCGVKPNGVQEFFLLTRTPKNREIAVMIERSGACYAVSVVCESAYFDGTLIVGELAWAFAPFTSTDTTDTSESMQILQSTAAVTSEVDMQHNAPVQVDPDVGVWRQEFKCFSCLSMKGLSLCRLPFAQRHEQLCLAISVEDDLIRNSTTWLDRATVWAQMGKLVCAGNEYCLILVVKPWQPLRNFSSLSRTHNAMMHPSDGYIIQNVHMPELPGRRPGCYKIKDVDTIDFEFRTDVHGNKQLWIQHGKDTVPANGSALIYCQGLPVEFVHKGLELLPDGHGEFECTILGTQPSQTQSNSLVLLVMATFKEHRPERRTPNDHITINGTLVNIVERLTPNEAVRDVDRFIQSRQSLSIIQLPSSALPS
jgi:hypothetical protein